MTKTQFYQVGDKVKLVKVAPQHNRHLKNKLGATGEVWVDDSHPSGMCNVMFNNSAFERFWVKPRYLEKV